MALWGIKWLCDRWCHVTTLKGQTRDPNMLRAQYLENGWTPFQGTTNRKWYMGYQIVTWPMTSWSPKVLWHSTVGYPSDSLASCARQGHDWARITSRSSCHIIVDFKKTLCRWVHFFLWFVVLQCCASIKCLHWSWYLLLHCSRLAQLHFCNFTHSSGLLCDLLL